ncbi:MAG: hypothetical protein AAF485_00415 [Chloroflexota bacterium]
MHIRKLQRQDAQLEWVDDGYALEGESGHTEFRCNALWGHFSAHYNKLLKKKRTPLEKIETVIYPRKGWRWLPIEIIDDRVAKAYLTQLDKDCNIFYLPLDTA